MKPNHSHAKQQHIKQPLPHYPHIGQRINRIYYFGTLALLAFYTLAFSTLILLTENFHSERRLSLVAPYHFAHYEQGNQGSKVISPLITIYDDFNDLPIILQDELSEGFEGVNSFQFDEEIPISEYAVYAGKIRSPSGSKIVYAVENTDAVEWNDVTFFFVEAAIFLSGFAALLIVSVFIVRAAKSISSPFIAVAEQLERQSDDEFKPIVVEEVTSQELEKTLSALNNYRQRIHDLMAREKSFTRYVSHELRTPMTVVKGAISILRKDQNERVLKQTSRIDSAVEQMEQLIQTFLLLVRKETSKDSVTHVDQVFVDKLVEDIAAKAEANGTQVVVIFNNPFELAAEPLLLYSAIHNILTNAINSTVNGEVVLRITPQQVVVIDNGVGLNEKVRGYEGFGIGLLLVKDICQKYHWSFELSENYRDRGCIAQLTFS